MSALTLTILRMAYLAGLWALVLLVVAVLRRDLYGTRITRRATAPPTPTPTSMPAQSAPNANPTPGPAPSASGGRRWRRGDDGDDSATPRALVVTEGSLRGTTITLGQAPILIGRAPECTLVLEDDYASGRHARFFLQGSTWLVEDLGSTNGTFLGRDKLEAPTPVGPGSSVRIGRTVLELRR
jgi:hypothetical protein